MFKKQTRLMVVGSSERPGSSRSADLFFSECSITLKDDTGVAAGEEDYSADFYEGLFRSLTSVCDWVFLPHFQSGMSLCVGIKDLNSRYVSSKLCGSQRTLLLASCVGVRELCY